MSPKLMAQRLNEMLRIDPIAINSLFGARTNCNIELTEHPRVTVGVIGEWSNDLSFLGILNGLRDDCSVQENAFLAARTDSDTDQILEFFVITTFAP